VLGAQKETLVYKHWMPEELIYIALPPVPYGKGLIIVLSMGPSKFFNLRNPLSSRSIYKVNDEFLNGRSFFTVRKTS